MDYNLEDTIRDALAYVPPDDRQTWLYMGFAVKSALGDAGFSIWDNWARRSSAYKEADARNTWRNDKGKSASGRAITVGTLFTTAQEWGWRPSQHHVIPPTPAPAAPAEPDPDQEERAREAATLSYTIVSVAETARHPYLANKGWPTMEWLVFTEDCFRFLRGLNMPEWRVKWFRKLLQETEGDLLIVPMRNVKTNHVQTLQFIAPDGTKKYLPGGKAGNAVYRLGPAKPRGPVWYVEGFATGLAVQHGLKYLRRDNDQAVICFSSGNLAKVGQQHKGRLRGFVVADHDRYICGEPKCAHRWDAPWKATECPECRSTRVREPAGEKYARDTGLPYWIPPPAGMDAHDFAIQHGYSALSQALRELAIY